MHVLVLYIIHFIPQWWGYDGDLVRGQKGSIHLYRSKRFYSTTQSFPVAVQKNPLYLHCFKSQWVFPSPTLYVLPALFVYKIELAQKHKPITKNKL
jgi:hypothetical protein